MASTPMTAAAGRTERWEALRATMRTAGRTVLFSSLTVAVALASLTVFPQRFLYSMGIGGACVALFAALVSLVVLPAVLSLLGPRINAGAPAFLQRRADRDARHEQAGFWYRLSRFVMRRPVVIALSSATLLIAPGPSVPAHPFHLGRCLDPAQERERSPGGRRASQRLPPVPRLTHPGRGRRRLPPRRRQGRLRASHDRGVAAVNPPQKLGGGVTVLDAISKYPYVDAASKDTVTRIRELPDPTGSNVLVTGVSAHYVDLQASLKEHIPTVLAIVVVATMVILFLMTGSVVLPVKALLMNVLNLSAVFGILVLVFQDGRFESLLGYTSQGGLEQTMPILLFAIAFGLSTDYAVFLLSRIKEARDSGIGDSEAVAVGLERTGRIVTAAALLFSIAIGAFATSKIIFLKENGIGTALAVLIDASIIRALLVPSLMELLGKWNWWAPAPLRRLHERWGVSEASPSPARAG